MACPCKKQIQRIVEYDKLAAYNGKVKEIPVVEVEEKTETPSNLWIMKVLSPMISIFRGIGTILLMTLLISAALVIFIPYVIYMIFMRVVFKKTVGGINNPFYSIDKFKKEAEEKQKILNRIKHSPKRRAHAA